MYAFFAIIGALIAIYLVSAAVYFTFFFFLTLFISPVFWIIFVCVVVIAITVYISCRPPY